MEPREDTGLFGSGSSMIESLIDPQQLVQRLLPFVLTLNQFVVAI